MFDHRYRVGRWVHLGTWTNDPKAMVWNVGHPGEFGRVTPGAVSGRCDLLGECTHIPRYRFWEGAVTLGTMDL